jgi:hypothetical protein
MEIEREREREEESVPGKYGHRAAASSDFVTSRVSVQEGKDRLLHGTVFVFEHDVFAKRQHEHAPVYGSAETGSNEVRHLVSGQETLTHVGHLPRGTTGNERQTLAHPIEYPLP